MLIFLKISKSNSDSSGPVFFLKEIITKYGHLRPGTYDATDPAYWEDPKYYLKPENSKINIKSSIFELSKNQRKSIAEFLENLGLVISADELIQFIYVNKTIVYLFI